MSSKEQPNKPPTKQSLGLLSSEPIPWPSERVPPCGLFHSAKMEYSKETADLVKLLMKEAHLSMSMQKQIDEHIRNGQPLPRPTPPERKIDPDEEALAILARARNAKRKSLHRIMASGAYDMPRYRPPPDDRVPAEKAKLKLQEVMSGLRIGAMSPVKAKRKPKEEQPPTSEEDVINELLAQIGERADWLAEMEELGEGRRFRDEIREQIAERLRRIKKVESKIVLQKEGYRYID